MTVQYARATIADLERERDYIVSRRQHWEAEACKERARADALQIRLTEAEQRAATEKRRGFGAGRDAVVAIVHAFRPLVFGSEVYAEAVKDLTVWTACRAAALTPPDASQEGETTP